MLFTAKKHGGFGTMAKISCAGGFPATLSGKKGLEFGLIKGVMVLNVPVIAGGGGDGGGGVP